MKKSFLLVDIIRAEDSFEENLGLASICATLRTVGYRVVLMKFYENKIDYCQVKNANCDVVGVSVGTHNIITAIDFCRNVKNNDCITFLGGYSATFYCNEILENYSDVVDFLVLGEGEHTLLEIANALERGSDLYNIKGIDYSNNGEIYISHRELIDNLDQLPLAHRDILRKYNLNIAPVETSRGCLGNCSFCSLKQFWIDKASSEQVCFRERDPFKVVDEIEYLAKEYGIKRIVFVDASYELSPKYKSEKLKIIARDILKRNIHISYYFSARVEFYKMVSAELLSLMIESGFSGIFLGVESFSQNDLTIYNKKTSVEENINAIKFFDGYPVNVDIGFINFHPYSTVASLKTNAKYVLELNYAARFFLIESVFLFKGTPIYDKCKKDGLIIEEELFHTCKYKFVNAEVGAMYSSICQFFDNYINSEISYTELISGFFNDHLDVVYGMINQFRFNGQLQALEIARDYLKVLKKNQRELSDFNYKWFADLIELAEMGCTECDEYLKVLKKNISVEYLSGFYNKLQACKMNLFLKIRRIDKNLVKYL